MTADEAATLPLGWVTSTVGEMANLNPSNPDRVPPDETEVSFVPMASVEALSGVMCPSARRTWRTVRKGYKRFQDGDVLVAKITPSMENGKAALASQLIGGVGAGSTEFHVIRPTEALVGKFLLHFLLQESVRREARAHMTGTAGQLRVPESFYESLGLHLPPLNEQHRIVEALDSYFTRLDAAQAVLERVQAGLKRYHASVLKAAVEGRLVTTEAELARKEGRDYEPASLLLERILAEHRRRWEEVELEKLIAQGQRPKNDLWKAKYREPAAPDTSELSKLPEGWCWVTADQIGEVTGGITKKGDPSEYPVEMPYLRVANIYANRLELGDIRTIGLKPQQVDSALVARGDLLIVEGNGSADQIGRAALWDGSIPNCVHQNHLIKVRTEPMNLAAWALVWLQSASGRQRILQVASSTSGLYTLSLSKVKAVPIPLPPDAERERISVEVDRMASLVVAEASYTRRSIHLLARLRQATLASAFAGKLIDQDPADAPADALLARIRSEQAESRPAPKRRRRQTT